MKDQEYLDMDFTDLLSGTTLNRRNFLKRFGGGIIIFFSIGDASAMMQEQRRQGYPSDFNAYLRIGADGRVTCLVGKIEMGQGAITSLAMELADELDVSLDSVDMVMGDTDRCPWDMGTFGSLSTRSFGPYLRQAAAEARAVLLELAADQLKKLIDQLQIKDGTVFDKNNAKIKISYAQLTEGKIIERHLEQKPSPKKPSEFHIMGKPVFRQDAKEKVTGEAKFAGDIQFPDMLYAKILRPPAHGAKLKNVDTSEAEKIAGVQIIKDGDFIAVLHKYPDIAEKALKKITSEFDIPEAKVDDKTIFDHLLKIASEGEVVAHDGSIETGEKVTSIVIEGKYLNSYVAHAPIEPHTATAKIDGDKITVWASTQAPFRAKDEVAQALGWAPEKVRIITPYVGGGFG
ncbi:MAG TPA: molybdopterin cofactor-binding domain-containing protein, partial [bacterium]